MYMDNEGTTLATELLHELKKSAKRWFIIAIIELMLLLALGGGFLWYISLPIDDTSVTQDVTNTDNSNVIGIGDYNNGEDKTDSPKNTESNKK